MYRICCPWCGEREQVEFRAAGEGHIRRPADPAAVDDAQWGDYVFMRRNPKGVHFERWVHVHGCRRWFHVARNTATDEILTVYGARDPAPPLAGFGPPTPCGDSSGSGFAHVEAQGVPDPGRNPPSPANLSTAGVTVETAADDRQHGVGAEPSAPVLQGAGR